MDSYAPPVVQLTKPIVVRCACCDMVREVNFKDAELGLICDSCISFIYWADIELNCRLTIGVCRP